MAPPPSRKVDAGAEDGAPPAYWNQEAYDRAVHLIDQPRQTELGFRFLVGGRPLAGKCARVYTRRCFVAGGDEFTERALDPEGRLRGRLDYGHSLVETEFPAESLPAGSGLESVALRWFRPGEWRDALGASLDLARFSLGETPVGKDVSVALEFAFDPAFTVARFYIAFGNLLGLEFSADGKTEATEAEARVVGAGRARLEFRMRDFFAKWNGNYSRPYRAGDAYAVSGSITLAPPPGFFESRPSARRDSPYAPRKYAGEVSHEDGNPFLDVPSTAPVEEVACTFSRQVKVTAAMLR